MTQTTFAPPPVSEAPVEESSTRSRRTVLIGGGIAAALALAAGGYFLLSGGSSTPSAADLPRGTLGLTPKAAKPAVKPVVKPITQVPPTTSVPIGRDPFHALYVAPAEGAAAAPAAGTGSTTTTSSTSTSTTSGSTSTQPAAPATYKLVLTKVSAGTATFSVGGKYMTAKIGSVFGPTAELKLLDLTDTSKGWVATIQVGDSEPVDATKGESLYVR
jgi:hypothetical protein